MMMTRMTSSKKKLREVKIGICIFILREFLLCAFFFQIVLNF